MPGQGCSAALPLYGMFLDGSHSEAGCTLSRKRLFWEALRHKIAIIN